MKNEPGRGSPQNSDSKLTPIGTGRKRNVMSRRELEMWGLSSTPTRFRQLRESKSFPGANAIPTGAKNIVVIRFLTQVVIVPDHYSLRDSLEQLDAVALGAATDRLFHSRHSARRVAVSKRPGIRTRKPL